MSAAVDIPPLVIEMDGLRLQEDDARALGEVRVHQKLSLPTVCELAFVDPKGSLIGEAAIRPGSSLRIVVEGFTTPLFEGEVTATEYSYNASGERRVHVRGYDLLHRLRKRQPVGSHIQVNLRELAQSLVADLGFSVEAADPGPLRQQLFQYGQSDLDLMAEAAERCGLYFSLRAPVLHLISLAGLGATVPLALGSSLIEAHIEINSEATCRTVESRAWDPERVVPVIGTANQARTGRDVFADVYPERMGGRGHRTLVDELAQDDFQAAGLAQSELDRRAARDVVFQGVAEGNTALRPGVPVDISGVDPPLAGRYVLTAVRHVIDHRKGFVSEMDTSPPPHQPRSRSTVATLGVVSRVNDPDEMGRIRVVLPNYGDVESGWFNVVMPGAGPGKGIVALPDIDDQVLVLLMDGDPAQGLVLGGLYGVTGPPDAGVENGAVRRYTLRTPGGLRVCLDDETNTIKFENGEGDRVELSPKTVFVGDSRKSLIELAAERCRIVSMANLDISAPGKRVTISGQSIDFERK